MKKQIISGAFLLFTIIIPMNAMDNNSDKDSVNFSDEDSVNFSDKDSVNFSDKDSVKQNDDIIEEDDSVNFSDKDSVKQNDDIIEEDDSVNFSDKDSVNLEDAFEQLSKIPSIQQEEFFAVFNEKSLEESLLDASSDGDLAKVEQLIKKGISPDVISTGFGGETPLIKATRTKKINIVKYLVNTCNATLDLKDGDGYTALIWAVHDGHDEIIQFLIESGANINTKNCNEETPFSKLVSYFKIGYEAPEKYTRIKLLIKNGANPNDRSVYDNQETLLHKMVIFGIYADDSELNMDIDMIKFLIRNNANINAQDIEGNTPLMLAYERGDSRIVKLLLTYGAQFGNSDKCRLDNCTSLIVLDNCTSLIADEFKTFLCNPLNKTQVANKYIYLKILLMLMQKDYFLDKTNVFAVLNNNNKNVSKMLKKCNIYLTIKEKNKLHTHGFPITMNEFDMKQLLYTHKKNGNFINVFIE